MPEQVPQYRNPVPTVDIVILGPRHEIVLVKRKNPPFGYAIPGGFVDEGEHFEDAAIREAKEETNLNVKLVCQFYTYTNPVRDPRKHVVSTVYIAEVTSWQGAEARDDAAELIYTSLYSNHSNEYLAFDHAKILNDVKDYMKTGCRRALD